MLIIPAVDIKNGKCVRLLQGKMDAETVFSDNPIEMAQQWVDQGAKRLHIVDLDGAIKKTAHHAGLISKLLQSISVPIQVGGGIRDINTIDMYIQMGVDAVILGTEAKKNPDFVRESCEQFPGKIIVGIDAVNGRVAIEGWTETTEMKAIDLAKTFEDYGVCAINFTDIQRDGMRSGVNIEQTVNLAKAVSIPIVASGGVASLDDIRSLLPYESIGIVGIITGRALYEGTLDLKQAIQIAGIQFWQY
ncbi:MAG: 1-(5-phosphoribosyl)-5-[(5-phosphoribosylamino)methylideneamino]imidazole-4-carboxamide isomerase [Desulfobacterales bacterium]|nr:1-(5-phosphoribosyl)-5-[(5-phosphoribosylamino)methylideneamino]imidazole-4-carboxamide isomerase [Desulfobacterales bacterium]